MATAATLAPHDVLTTLNYYVPVGDEPPFAYADKAPEGRPQNNTGLEPHPVVVQDAQGRESEFSVDTTGFHFVKHVSAEKDFDDEERIKTVYYKEVEELLKREVDAKRVYIYNHIIRRKQQDDRINEPWVRSPVERVHIDQTLDASVKDVHYHLGDEADRLLKGRVRSINVWRPIHHPVAHMPLAVSDWRYLDTERDLVSVRFFFPDREGSYFIVRYNPSHRWYYLSNQTPEEVTLIKCYDSEVDKARLTPHSAFADATSLPEAPHRESIEVRCLVFDIE